VPYVTGASKRIVAAADSVASCLFVGRQHCVHRAQGRRECLALSILRAAQMLGRGAGLPAFSCHRRSPKSAAYRCFTTASLGMPMTWTRALCIAAHQSSRAASGPRTNGYVNFQCTTSVRGGLAHRQSGRRESKCRAGERLPNRQRPSQSRSLSQWGSDAPLASRVHRRVQRHERCEPRGCRRKQTEAPVHPPNKPFGPPAPPRSFQSRASPLSQRGDSYRHIYFHHRHHSGTLSTTHLLTDHEPHTCTHY
jgi:hypothetical protein